MENTCTAMATEAFQIQLPLRHLADFRYSRSSTVVSPFAQPLVPRWRIISRNRREWANTRTCDRTFASPVPHGTASAGGGRRMSEEAYDGSETLKLSPAASAPSVGMNASTKSRQRLNQQESVSNASELSRRRRSLIFSTLSILLAFSPSQYCTSALATMETTPSGAMGEVDSGSCPSFRSGAYGTQEYTNSLTASRDTNISPREVYDSIASKYLRAPLELGGRGGGDDGGPYRALDFGAGAGVSTQILYEMGYTEIDAVDWSGDAWERYVVDDPAGCVPPGGGVRFFEMDDERYRASWRREGGAGGRGLFDAVVFNFAVNEDKAKSFASELLARNDRSRLLAPVNVQKDYWLRQEYRCYDRSGNVLWRAGEVGAWSVQFQPDVTQDSCQGIWCAPFNGFRKMELTGSGAMD